MNSNLPYAESLSTPEHLKIMTTIVYTSILGTRELLSGHLASNVSPTRLADPETCQVLVTITLATLTPLQAATSSQTLRIPGLSSLSSPRSLFRACVVAHPSQTESVSQTTRFHPQSRDCSKFKLLGPNQFQRRSMNKI